MSDEPIAPYVAEGVDAGEELRALGLDVARQALRHMQRIVSGERKYEHDQTFHSHMGISAYKAEFGACFILHVVEQEADQSLRVTLMAAAKISDFTEEKSEVWSAAALAAVKAMVSRRLEVFFNDNS